MAVDLATKHELVGDLLKLPRNRDEWERFRLTDEQVAFNTPKAIWPVCEF